jgi:hypothetical protein
LVVQYSRRSETDAYDRPEIFPVWYPAIFEVVRAQGLSFFFCKETSQCNQIIIQTLPDYSNDLFQHHLESIDNWVHGQLSVESKLLESLSSSS